MIFSVAICAAMPAVAQHADINPKVLAYIDKYKDLAIQEQIRTGVPAAIKLAQGIHETAFGTSELCNNANNHFGIKCKSTWTGASYTYDDDAKNECFRKYQNDYESYMDHSDFLKVNKRYANLFELDITDYKGWARGLKAAGYATHPQYANLIINTIEKYNLNSYTLLAQNTKAIDYSKLNLVAQANNKFTVTKTEQANSTTITATKTDINSGFAANNAPRNSTRTQSNNAITYYELTTKNGLKGFYVQQGDHLLGYADKFNIRYSKLLKNNELADAPVSHDMFIYLDKKLDKGLEKTYTVEDGETLIAVSQETGVSIEKLKYYNNLVDGVEPQVGSVLNLQHVSEHTPEVYIPSKYPASQQQTVKNQDRYASNKDNYIYNSERMEQNTARQQSNESTKREPSFEQYKSKMGKPTEVKSNQETIKVAQTPAPEPKIEEKSTEKSGTLSPYDKLKMHMANSKDKKPEVDYSTYDYTPAAKTSTTTQTATSETVRATTSSNTSTINHTNDKYYIVKKGDTLFSIAKNNDVTVDELQRWNNVTPKTLTVGKKLQVKK